MTKPRLGKVRALFYVLQQATEKEAAPILTQPLFVLYCLGLKLPFGRVESTIGGEGLRLCEAPSPPIAVSTLRPQKIWGYAGGKLHFDFDFRHDKILIRCLLFFPPWYVSPYPSEKSRLSHSV